MGENLEHQGNIYATDICNGIYELLLEPRIMAQSMNNMLVYDLLKEKDKISEEECSQLFGEYLSSIVRNFQFDTAFFVDGSNNNCYSVEGYVKTLDYVNREEDQWYSEFLASGVPYSLTIDQDLSGNDQMMINVNCRVEDSEGRFIGVCGIGVCEDQIHELIQNFEDKYKLIIHIVSAEGKHQLNEHEETKENKETEREIKKMLRLYDMHQEYMYEAREDGGFLIVKRIPESNWFLAVEESGQVIELYNHLLVRNVIGCIIVLVLVIIIFHTIINQMDKGNASIRANEEEQRNIIQSLADIYSTMHMFDLEHGVCKELATNEIMRKVVLANQGKDIQTIIRNAMRAVTQSYYLESMLEFTDFYTLSERMRGHKIISQEYFGGKVGWARASFIKVKEDDEQKVCKVLFVTQIIDDDKKREEQLVRISRTDELTRALNRRAYDEMIEQEKRGNMQDLVIISVDVNGLKEANDKLGHAAGDELILGATQCMRSAFTGLGEIYRTGGDEFMVLLHCSNEQLEKMLLNLEQNVENWTGTRIKQLAIAKGIVVCNQYPNRTLEELEKLADQFMYEDKADYYLRTGKDRRSR